MFNDRHEFYLEECEITPDLELTLREKFTDSFKYRKPDRSSFWLRKYQKSPPRFWERFQHGENFLPVLECSARESEEIQLSQISPQITLSKHPERRYRETERLHSKSFAKFPFFGTQRLKPLCTARYINNKTG